MFVAMDTRDGSRVTSIAPEWDDAVDALREIAVGGWLVCPGCQQPLHLRAGLERRRHFAHRMLSDCPLAAQSPEVMEAKAQLYRWLLTKYPGKVQLDACFGAPPETMPADLVVEAGKRRWFAYWVFDRQKRDREELLDQSAASGVHAHFIHMPGTLRKGEDDHLLLTASQRDFVDVSDYDGPSKWPGAGHLHFLSTADTAVTIYRGLRCVHDPNVYRFTMVRTGLLAEALISPRTGEIVLRQDVQDRDDWRRQNPSRDPGTQFCWTAAAADHGKEDTPEGAANDRAPTEHPPSRRDGPFRCEHCGALTTAWSMATPSAGTCVCRDCTRERWRTT